MLVRELIFGWKMIADWQQAALRALEIAAPVLVEPDISS
jgi:hypothetical protein